LVFKVFLFFEKNWKFNIFCKIINEYFWEKKEKELETLKILVIGFFIKNKNPSHYFISGKPNGNNNEKK